DRGEVLLGEARAFYTGEDDAAATAILADERQVLPLFRGAGDPGSPLGRSEAARVDGVDRRRQQIDALQEERALLRQEEREALVGGDVRDVGLDLREVGVDRDVDDGVGVRKPLAVDAAVELAVAGRERRPEVAARPLPLLRRRE